MTSTKPQQLANSFRYLMPVLVANLIQLVTLPVFTRFVPTEDFGAWALAGSYAVVAGGIAMLGVQSTYERNFFQYTGDSRPTLLYSVVAFSSAALSVAVAVTWWWRASISLWLTGNVRYQEVVVMAFAGTALMSVKDYFMTYLRSDEQATSFAVYSIADRALAAVLQMIAVVMLGLGVRGIVIGQVIATAALLIMIVAKFLRCAPWTFAWGPVLDSLKLGLPTLPRMLLVSVGNNADKYLVSRLSSLGAAGVYAVGQRVATIGFNYLVAINNVYKPKVYQMMFHGGANAPVDIGRYLTPFAYIASLFAFLVAVFSEEALLMLAPGSYAAAITVVTLLALHYGLQFFGTMPQIMFAGKTYWIPILTASAMIFNLGLGVLGIRWFGMVGAAWGALAAGAINAAATFVIGQQCYRVVWQRERMAAIFAGLVASALVMIVLRGLGTPYFLLLAAKLAMTGLYLWVGYRLGVVTSGNLKLVRDFIAAGGRTR